MKLLITTRADDNIREMTDITHPFIREYAKKVNANFMILDHETDCNHNEGKWHYRIFRQYELFGDYDRILHLDSDILVLPGCPDLFQEVPMENIGTIFEDAGSRKGQRRNMIRKVQQHWGNVGWETGYINTGVFLTSKPHRDIFQKVNGRYWTGWGYDDVHLGYQIRRHQYAIHELGFKWNHMTMFSEPWNGNASRFDSHIIHYAGQGRFDQNNRIAQLKHDRKMIYPQWSSGMVAS